MFCYYHDMAGVDYRLQKHPALVYILRGFMPFTRENVLLSFKPARFFAEMEKVSGYSSATLKSTYYRARKDGLFEIDVVPKLTEKGLRHVRPYVAKHLPNNGRLLVLFDIPENRTNARRAFRNLLRSLGLTMVQKSVWMTADDHRELILETIKALELDGYVELHESVRLHPK